MPKISAEKTGDSGWKFDCDIMVERKAASYDAVTVHQMPPAWPGLADPVLNLFSPCSVDRNVHPSYNESAQKDLVY